MLEDVGAIVLTSALLDPAVPWFVVAEFAEAGLDDVAGLTPANEGDDGAKLNADEELPALITNEEMTGFDIGEELIVFVLNEVLARFLEVVIVLGCCGPLETILRDEAAGPAVDAARLLVLRTGTDVTG